MSIFRAAFADELLKTAAAPARSMLTPESSNVRGYRYDAKAKQLFVTYKSGGTYRYDDVPSNAVKALGRNRSVGKTINQLIKTPGYAYEKIGMSEGAIAGAVRRALEGGHEAQVAKFIRRTGAQAGERMAMGKGVAVREARNFLAGHPSIAGNRTGNVLPAVAGEFEARFGHGEGKTAALHAMVAKVANGDMIEYFRDHPQKLREKRERDRRKSLPKEAGSLIEVFGKRRRRMAKVAGVAKKQVTWNGLPMKIEHEPGDIRSGKSKDGKEWARKMFASYGYVPGTGGKGADGEAIDIYFAKDPVDGPAHKVKQLKQNGDYDEDKYMIGYPSKEEAKKEYLRHMPEWAFGGIASVGDTFEDFKSFIKGL